MHSQPQCVSELCDYPMDEKWDFCPACGADNRPPSERRTPSFHHHRFPFRSGYCVRCGEPAGEPYAFGYKWRMRFSGVLIVLGVSALLGMGLIQVTRTMPSTPMGKWVNSWYDQRVEHRGGRRSGYRVTYSSLGADWTLALGAGGATSVCLGLWMLFGLPFRNGRGDRLGDGMF